MEYSHRAVVGYTAPVSDDGTVAESWRAERPGQMVPQAALDALLLHEMQGVGSVEVIAEGEAALAGADPWLEAWGAFDSWGGSPRNPAPEDAPAPPRWLAREIERLREREADPRRRRREAADDLPWDDPLFAALFAAGKISRVMITDARDARLVGKNAEIAEELREAAHYLLRAAALLDGERRP